MTRRRRSQRYVPSRDCYAVVRCGVCGELLGQFNAEPRPDLAPGEQVELRFIGLTTSRWTGERVADPLRFHHYELDCSVCEDRRVVGPPDVLSAHDNWRMEHKRQTVRARRPGIQP